MDTETYFGIKRNITNYCNKGDILDETCQSCPLYIMNNPMHVRCSVLEQDYPIVAEQLLYEAIRMKFPNGYLVCRKNRKFVDVNKCLRFNLCEDCENENRK